MALDVHPTQPIFTTVSEVRPPRYLPAHEPASPTPPSQGRRRRRRRRRRHATPLSRPLCSLRLPAQDTYLKVWALPDSEDKSASEVALIYEERAEDRFLTGVQFTRDGSERILAAAYDSKELLVWDRI